MRTLYLIRHGQPLVHERHTCGYPHDVPLSEAGLRQGAELRNWARDKSLTAVYSSPALRCVQTAQALSDGQLPILTDSGLAEMDTGAWTGLSFEEIKRRWPAEYAQRGQSIGAYPIPGGESFVQAGERMDRTIARVLSQSEGDIAVVAHSGVNRGWLCRLLGRSPNQVRTLPQPWSGITGIQTDGARFFVQAIGVRPIPYPSQEEIQALWTQYATPAPVRAHCEAVARRAEELAEQINQPVDLPLLRAACLLHDLVRDWPNHAYSCCEIMVREGWPLLGGIITLHHDLPEEAGVEASLLYLADKLVQGSQPVRLEERFAAKRSLCWTPKALAAWEQRYRRAQQAAKQLGLDIT